MVSRENPRGGNLRIYHLVGEVFNSNKCVRKVVGTRRAPYTSKCKTTAREACLLPLNQREIDAHGFRKFQLSIRNGITSYLVRKWFPIRAKSLSQIQVKFVAMSFC